MKIREMNLYVYNKSMQLVGIVDRYIALIWTDRYDECGDFELTIDNNADYKKFLIQDYYVRTDYSDRWAIIEKIEANTSEDMEIQMIYSGRTVECFLERRIVLKKTTFGEAPKDENSNTVKVNMQESFEKLMNENVINPAESNRKISNIAFAKSSDTAVTKVEIQEEFQGEKIFDILSDFCTDNHLGFKMTLNSANKFVLTMYSGKDRTISTNTSDYVIFSPMYDNMRSSDYYTSKEKFANYMYVRVNSDDGENFTLIEVCNQKKTPTGLDRREVQEEKSTFVKDGEQENKVNEEKIKTRALRMLDFDYKMETAFDGEIVPNIMYEYRKDYNVGDKVQFQDYFGNNSRVWISEITISFEEEGLSIVPTFEEIDWDEHEAE